MTENLKQQISQWFDDHREAILEDLKRIVRIPSVTDETSEVKPFGQACREAMDEMLTIGREHGFFAENYEYYVGRIGEKDAQPEQTIGFFNHLDVVPVGNGWTTDPFDPVIREGFLIGRGTGDNKGPAIGMLYLMQCLKELGVPMKHKLSLYVGCNEEKRMADMQYFTANYECPKICIVADSGFPVCYGEKGILEGFLTSSQPFSEAVLQVYGGSASNMVPDRAYAKIKDTAEAREWLASMGVCPAGCTAAGAEENPESASVDNGAGEPVADRQAQYL